MSKNNDKNEIPELKTEEEINTLMNHLMSEEF